MTAPTPSLLFAFWDVEDVKQEIQMGAMISGPLILIPGTMVFAQAMFWDDLGRVLMTSELTSNFGMPEGLLVLVGY